MTASLTHGRRLSTYVYTRPNGVSASARSYGVNAPQAHVMLIRRDGRWKSNGVWGHVPEIDNDDIVFVEARKIA